MWGYILLALALRLALLVYGEWQDQTFVVKFTDVDYFVFSDAADFIHQGKSPYDRATYRYTPLLAWMLLPNLYLGPAFGKILFILFDVAAGWLIYDITSARGHNPRLSTCCACIWLFNPLSATVSSRGNAESIMAFLVLLTLRFLSSRNVLLVSLSYAMSVHFKIYPVTYSLPLYFVIGTMPTNKAIPSGEQPGWFSRLMTLLLPNKNRIIFMVVTGCVLSLLTAAFYAMYGWDFLEHSYLYHVTRKDIRHNFSVYFYMLYLTAESAELSWLSLAVFTPQAVLLLLISIKFYKDPPFCFFLHTFIFVTFNKVCTSQYFLWYLCLLPVILPQLRLKLSKAILIITAWFLAQGLWLLPAYYLEFEGRNTFIYIWCAGILFFLMNIYIARTIIRTYTLDCWDDRDVVTLRTEDKVKIS